MALGFRNLGTPELTQKEKTDLLTQNNPKNDYNKLIMIRIYGQWLGLMKISQPRFLQTFVEMLTLFSCMCMMASDTLTETESAASSMLNGPSNFSETWYRASERKKIDRKRCQRGSLTVFLLSEPHKYTIIILCLISDALWLL